MATEWLACSTGQLDELASEALSQIRKRKKRPGALFLRKETIVSNVPAAPSSAPNSPTMQTPKSQKYFGIKRYNCCLPTCQDVARDADMSRSIIMKGLQSAIEKHDAPGLLHNLSLVHRHLDLDYTFSTEERAWMAEHLYYSVVVPHLDITTVHTIAGAVARLAKVTGKRIPGLTLDWRPAYQLLQTIYFRKQRSAFLVKESVTQPLLSMLRSLRRYWSADAPEQIMNTIRPMLCPLDPIIFRAQGLLSLFMPTESADREKPVEWLSEYVGLWSWMDNSPPWDYCQVSLLSRVAHDRIGGVDWSPHLTTIYANILRVFDLPTSHGNLASAYNRMMPHGDQELFFPAGTYFMDNVGRWIVWSIDTPGALDLLNELCATLHPYFHPDNGGPWTGSVATFLDFTSCHFYERIQEENSPASTVPENRHLSEELINSIGKALFPLACTAVYNPESICSSTGNQCLRRLVSLSPDWALPLVLERAQRVLTVTLEPHETTATLDLLSYIVLPLLNKDTSNTSDTTKTNSSAPGASAYSEFGYGNFDEPEEQQQTGLQTVIELLCLTVPPNDPSLPSGIDPNNILKTNLTLRFVYILLNLLPFREYNDNPLLAELVEDWALQFTDRILLVLKELPATSKVAMASSDAVSPALLHTCLDTFFSSLTPELHSQCLDRLLHWLLDGISSKVTLYVGIVVDSICFASPEQAYKRVIPTLLGKLLTEKGQMEDLSGNELVWYCTSLTSAIKRGGEYLLPYKTQLNVFLVSVWFLCDSESVRQCCKLLKALLSSLSTVYTREIHSYNPTENEDSNLWGRLYSYETVDLQWHQPSAAEVDWAVALANNYLTRAIGDVHYCLSGTGSISDLENSLVKIKAISKGGCLLFGPLTKTSAELCRKYRTPKLKATWLEDYTFADRTTNPVEALTHSREGLIDVVCSVATLFFEEEKGAEKGPKGQRVKGHPPTTTNNSKLNKSMQRVCKLGKVLLGCSPYNHVKFINGTIGFKVMKHCLTAHGPRGGKCKKLPRTFIAQRAELHYQRRFLWHSVYQHTTPSHLKFAGVSQRLAMSTTANPDSRQLAIETYGWVLNMLPDHISAPLIKDVIELLPCRSNVKPQTPEEIEDTVTKLQNCVALLSLPGIVKTIVSSWQLIPEFITTCCKIWEDAQKAEAWTDALLNVFHTECYQLALDPFPGSTQADARIGEHLSILDNLFEAIGHASEEPSAHWRVKERALKFMLLLTRCPANHDSGVRVPRSMIDFVLKNCWSEYPKVRGLAATELHQLMTLYKPSPNVDMGEDIAGSGQSSPASPASPVHSHQQAGFVPIQEGGEATQPVRSLSPVHMGTQIITEFTRCTSKNTSIGSVQSIEEMMEAQPEPTNEEEFNETVWFDKNSLGFYAFPDVLTFRALVSRQKMLTAPTAEDKEFFLDRLIHHLTRHDICAFIREVCAEFRHKRAPDPCQFNALAAQFWKGFFQVTGVCMFKGFSVQILEWLGTHNESNGYLASVAEMVGGLLRAMKSFSYEETESAWQWIDHLVMRVLETASQREYYAFEAGYRFGVYNQDPRRIQRLMRQFIKFLDTVPEDSGEVLKPLRSIAGLLAQYSWKAKEQSRGLLPLLLKHWDHTYEQVRETVSACISIIFKLECSFPRGQGGVIEPGQRPHTQTFLIKFIDDLVISTNKLKKSGDAAQIRRINHTFVMWFATNADSTLTIEPYVLTYLRLLANFMTEEHDPEGLLLMENVSAVLAQGNYNSETVLLISRWLAETLTKYSEKGWVTPPITPPLQPVVGGDLPPTLEGDSGNLKFGISPPTYMDTSMQQYMNNGAYNGQWRLLPTLLKFAAVLVFRNQFYFYSEEGRKACGSVGQAVARSLFHKNPEVNTSAMDCITVMIQCLPSMLSTALREELVLWTSGNVKQVEGLHFDTKKITEAGYLGLCGVLQAFPFTMPDFIPAILATLAKHVHSCPPQLASTVRSVFSEWRKTHQEGWEMEFKLKFTEEQLYSFSDVLSAPSFYA